MPNRHSRLEAFPGANIPAKWDGWDRPSVCECTDKMKITERSLQEHDIKSIVKRLNANDSACKLHHQPESTCATSYMAHKPHIVGCIPLNVCASSSAWQTDVRSNAIVDMNDRGFRCIAAQSFVLEWKLKQGKNIPISGGGGGCGGLSTHQVVSVDQSTHILLLHGTQEWKEISHNQIAASVLRNRTYNRIRFFFRAAPRAVKYAKTWTYHATHFA